MSASVDAVKRRGICARTLEPLVADAEIQKGGFPLFPDFKPRKRPLLGGSGGMPPQKIFEK